jgi:BirA family biotin operon repressor/biotin-[acetyl-CoA-carboxylase] ligase
MDPSRNSFKILASVDSTNNYAFKQIRDKVAKHGDAWFSYEQTDGKGRRGKTWKTENGKNIILSVAVSADFLTIYQQFYLSVAVCLGSIDLFKKYAGDEFKIKWPNDIFWNDRKAGGILIENIITGNTWHWSVIGMGMNINQTDFSVDAVFKPVSLKQITGKDFDVVETAQELYKAVMERYNELQKNGVENMLAKYNEHLFGLNKKVKLKKDNAVFETIIKGVSPQGKLITADSMEREFDFDEVIWLGEERAEGDKRKV